MFHYSWEWVILTSTAIAYGVNNLILTIYTVVFSGQYCTHETSSKLLLRCRKEIFFSATLFFCFALEYVACDSEFSFFSYLLDQKGVNTYFVKFFNKMNITANSNANTVATACKHLFSNNLFNLLWQWGYSRNSSCI